VSRRRGVEDLNNQRLDDVIVTPCTSNVSRSQEPTQYRITGAEIATAGIKVPSVARCESLMTVPKTLIRRALGHLSDGAMTAINGCVRDALMLQVNVAVCAKRQKSQPHTSTMLHSNLSP
jgi:mRNA interferase MazF